MRRTNPDKKPIALEDIAADTLRGDVRDFLLGWFRNAPKPWPQMSEAEQKNFVAAADKQAEALVRATTSLVGSQGYRAFEVSVGDFQKKGNRLEAKILATYSRDNLIEMAEAGEAGPIVLSLVSMDAFLRERAPAKVMADQPDLMDEEGDDAEGTGEQQNQVADATAAGASVDPATGEVIEVQPEENQRQGEQRLLTYERDDDGGPIIDHDNAGDDLASSAQREALGGGTGALTQAELDAMTPEQRLNVERLDGIQALKPWQAEPIKTVEDGDGGTVAAPSDAPKRRGRKTTEQRVAENARAAEAGRML